MAVAERERAAPEASQEELAKVLPFLFAVRWGAWAIAWAIVWVGHLSKVNSSHEPVLLAITFSEILGTTLYVPLLRSRVRRVFGARLGPRDDLIVLGLLGVAVALIVTYYSGGWSSPYYHYGLASLMVPAFLLGWRRSVLLLIGFLGAYFAVLSTAGPGLDGTWVDEDIAAIIMTPALVIVVVQYLAQLARRLDQQRGQAQRSLLETSALYSVAQTVATADRPETLVAHVVETLEGLSRFEGLAVLTVRDGGALSQRSRVSEKLRRRKSVCRPSSRRRSLSPTRWSGLRRVGRPWYRSTCRSGSGASSRGAAAAMRRSRLTCAWCRRLRGSFRWGSRR